MPSIPFLLDGTTVTTSTGTTGGGAILGAWFQNTCGEPIVITELGRWQRAGNVQTHSLRVYTVTAHLAAATLLGAVDVNCSGATVDAYLRGVLPAPVTIQPGEHFFCGSEEFTGGDTYGSNGGTAFATTGIAATWSAYIDAGIAYKGTDSNRGFGPVNFWYSAPIANWTKSGTVYTTDGNRYSVQGAIDDADDGDTIDLPADSFTWGAGGAYLSVYKPVHLRGAGRANTEINISSGGGTYVNATIRITAAATLSGMRINQPASGNPTTAISATGANGWRITDVDYHSDAVGAAGYFVYFGTFGLIDNCTVTGGVGSDEWIYGRGPTDAWQTATNKGSANAVYIEDCTLNAQGYLDANANASVVIRNCTITPTVGAIKLDGHGEVTNTPRRSFRLMEAYRNTWTTSQGVNPCFEVRGATGFIWGNSSVSGRIYLGDYNVVYGYMDAGDYPLPDQIGVGQDPKVAGSEPFYLWNNTQGGANWPAMNQIYATLMTGVVEPDRDYFDKAASFTGASGVGSGTRAQMDAITPTLPGVAFWVTDEASWDATLPAGTSGQLYQWNGSAWVLYYTPYTYPHPLRAGAASEDSGRPYAPTAFVYGP